MKVLVIEMTRQVERRLGGGETQTLLAGKRYTMSDADAAPLLQPTTKFVKENGTHVEKTVPPAATVVQETVVEGEEAQAKLAEAKAATRTKAQEETYFAQASEAEKIRDLEAEANAPKPVAAPAPATVDEEDGE